MARQIHRPGLAVALVFVCFLIASEVFAAQTLQNEIVPGTVNESVVVQNDPEQSYAIYLPASYSTKQKWPIVICLIPVRAESSQWNI